jgi:protein O-mannosyl-transferase
LWARIALAFGAHIDESGVVIAVLAILIAVLLVYAQTLGAPLLWDDHVLIPGVPLVERGGTLDEYLKAPFWSGAASDAVIRTYYRPLVTLSFALDHAIHHGNAAGYHLTNVVLHLTCSLLLHSLLLKMQVRPAVSVLVTIAWAVQPRLAEAAAWVSGRTDMVAALFALAALRAWGPGTGRRVLSSVLIGLGLLGKESAAAAILAIVLSEWAHSRGRPTSEALRHLAKAVAPILVVFGAYLALRFRAVGLVLAERELGLVGRVKATLDATGTYGAMLLDPFRPRALIGVAGIEQVSGMVAGAVVIVGALVLVVRVWRQGSPQVVLGLGLAFGSILPVLHLVPIPVRTLAADRFLYLPTAGLVLAFAPSLDRVLAARRPAWLAACAFVAALAVAGARRVALWSDEIAFWTQTYLETPRSNNSGATNLASLYYNVGMYEDALALFRRALTYDDPHRHLARYNLALTLSRLGRNEEARRTFIEFAPPGVTDASRLFHIGLVELRMGQQGSARARLETAARQGHHGARWLVPRLDEIEKGRKELAAAGASARPEDRARLAGILGTESLAVSDWVRVLSDPATDQRVAREALVALVQSGGVDGLRAGVRHYTARFGAVDAATMASIEVRLAELDRLVATRSVVGLGR